MSKCHSVMLFQLSIPLFSPNEMNNCLDVNQHERISKSFKFSPNLYFDVEFGILILIQEDFIIQKIAVFSVNVFLLAVNEISKPCLVKKGFAHSRP